MIGPVLETKSEINSLIFKSIKKVLKFFFAQYKIKRDADPIKNVTTLISEIFTKRLVEISTKKIFESINIEKKKKRKKERENTLISFLRTKKNDLEVSAITQCNKIESILKTLRQTNSILTRMTGSGATCFSLFEDKKDLNKAEESIIDLYPEFWTKKTKILNRF